MNADRDTTRVVRSWLRTDEHENADRVLDSVLSSLDTTPQRRHPWPARRLTRMINGTRMAVGAAAAVFVLAILGYNLIPQTTGIGTRSTPSPTASPPPTAPPPPLSGQAWLDGRYTVTGIGSNVRSASVAVPAGWRAGDDWHVMGPKGYDAPDGMGVRFYLVGNVISNPAALSEGFMDPPVGPTVEDLVQALVDHPAWTASTPSDVTIGGRAGQKVSITVPLDAQLAGDSIFYLFSHPLGGETWGLARGQVFDFYIVDVDGTRVVIDAYRYPGTSADDVAAQQAVVDSIEFAPNP